MKYWNDWTKTFVLFVLALLIYGFGIGRDFVFDDIVYISQNPLLRREDAFRTYWFSSEAFNYYPLFWSLLRLQWLAWGDHSLGYHLVSLLLHGLNAVLVWKIGRAWRLPGAWWVAALFAVHPVNVQTVAWAAEQKNTWSFLFMALALLAFIKHARDNDSLSYGLSLLCFLAALACKSSIVCLPIFLAIYYGLRRERNSLPLLRRLIPFFIAGVAAGMTTMWFEQNRVHAKSLMSALSLWGRMDAAGAAFWFYLEKALLPIHLTPMYRGWVDTTAASHNALPGIFLILLIAGCALTWRRIGAPVALGVTYYALMMLPLLGIFDTNYFSYSQIADHWQYHALPGLLVAVVSVARHFGSRLTSGSAVAAGTFSVLGLAALASAHFAHFEDARTLWRYVVEQNPDAWIAWYNLGNDYSDKREYPEAITAYYESIRVKPDYAQSYFNLANAFAATNQLQEADHAFLEARKISPADPDGYVNRGVTLMRMGRENEASAEFSHALELEPGKRSAQINLARLKNRAIR
ncbi:MAG: tetratricopeptide repeat protein [Verrucomicrobiota bacterium]|nr:tetratricopeptide repeat protein [Verrucomicrobiota bacterium]